MDPIVNHDGRIRPLELNDREPLIAAVRATAFFSEAEVDIARELIDVVLVKPQQEDYYIYVYADGTGPLGYYCIGPTPGTEGTFDLYWIVVAPGSQGMGVGSALDAHAESVIRSRGGRLVIAETSSTARYDRTRAFYVHRGYTEVSRIRDYYRPGDDLVVFGKYFV